MMINTRFSSRIVRSFCLLRYRYEYVVKLFVPHRKIITDRTPISHSVFLDYVQSTKICKAGDTLQESTRFEYDRIENFEYCEKVWHEDLEKKRIKLLLEKIDPVRLRRSIHDIDMKCESLINELTIEEILEFLILFLRIIPSGLFRMNFYSRSIDILKTALERNQLKHQDALKLLFFASVVRKTRVSNVKLIMRYMQPFNKLSLIEKSIVSNIVFKCSIKLSRLQGRVIEETIEKNSELLVTKSDWLVPLCKALRHVGPSKQFSMNNLSEALTNTQSKFNLPTISHIVNLYSEAYFKNTDVLSKLFNDAFNYIFEEYDYVRLKDIDRLLWSGRVLNYPLKSNEIEIIETLIERGLREKRVANVSLLNILLSLWMLGHKSTWTIKQCFENKIFEKILEEKAWKCVARLDLLLSCIRIEAPEIQIPHGLHISQKIGPKIRRNIKIMFRSLEALKNDLRLCEVKFCCPIDGIYIFGISAKYNNITNVHIDVLDEATCLRESDELHGLMQLKLRLLAKIGYQSILVPETIVEHPEVLREYMNKSLNQTS